MSSPKFQHGGARAALFILWLLHWLPLPLLALMGRALGAFLYRVAGSRRKVALRNLELCFPEKTQAEREAIAKEHFGWLAGFAGLDMPASSEWTQKTLGWKPVGPGLIEDLSNMKY